MRRLSFIIITLLACIGNSYAEDKVEVKDVTIAVGKNAMLYILLSNPDAQYTAIQADLYLSEGLEIESEGGDYQYELNRVADSHSLGIGKFSGYYRLILSSTKNDVFEGTSGRVISLKVKAGSSVVPGEKNCSLKDVKMVKKGGSGQTIENIGFLCQILDVPSTVPVTIGGAGYTTYTSQYSLDFTDFGDEVKAYIATGYDYDNGTIWLTRVKDVPAGTPLVVKGTASKTYEVPVKASSGSYYKNMLVGNLSGGTIMIGGTTDGMTDYYLKNGSFLSADGTNTIVNGKAYLQIPTSGPSATVGSSQAVKLNDYGFASFCGSQDLDFTDVEGLKAFAVTGYDDANGTIWMTRVNRVSAQTPLLLKGDSKGSYTIPSLAVGSYYANMLKGNLSGDEIKIYTTDGDMTNYYLKGNQLLKATDGGNTIGNGKAYMQIPSKHVTRSMEDVVADLLIYGISDDEPEVISIPVVGARGFDGEGTTGIHSIENGGMKNDVYYNLQGQRVEHPTKGIYIKNGRKVVIRSTTK